MDSKTYKLTLSDKQLDRMARDIDFRYETLKTASRMIYEKILFDVVKKELEQWEEAEELVPYGHSYYRCDIGGGDC